jgi:adenylate cyclase
MMPLEIERKFLVDTEKLGKPGNGTRYRQGYLPAAGKTSVRVRISDGSAWLTLKGKTVGATRLEFEYPVPVADAEGILDSLCEGSVIDKTRHLVDHAGHTWEVDIFAGDNAGLVIAEVELDAEDEVVELPEWVAGEVTDDPRYYNANLVTNPYCNWK